MLSATYDATTLTYTVVLSGFVSSTTASGLSLRAVNAAGASLSATGQKSGTTVPAAPSIASVTSTSTTSVSVAITAPAVGGAVVNTNYEYSLDGGTTWIARSPAAITTPLAIAGLTANTAYSLRLRAVNAGGKGEASSTTAFTTVPAAPDRKSTRLNSSHT